MRPTRVHALVVLAVGVIVGTWSDTAPSREVMRSGDRHVLAGDFHVHGFPGDGTLTPWGLRDEARHAGLDVFGLTNHNRTEAGRVGEWVAEGSEGPIVVAGQEVTTPGYHMIALGITRPIRADRPVVDAIAEIHAQGGVAIAAHPYSYYFAGWSDDAIAMLDGVEVAHPMGGRDDWHVQLMDFYARARAINPGIAAVGSSDMHATAMMGACRTFLFVRERTAAGVLEALREGMTVAENMAGRLHGPPDLVRRLEQARPAGRADPPMVRRISLALVWIGLLGAVLLGSRQDRS